MGPFETIFRHILIARDRISAQPAAIQLPRWSSKSASAPIDSGARHLFVAPRPRLARPRPIQARGEIFLPRKRAFGEIACLFNVSVAHHQRTQRRHRIGMIATGDRSIAAPSLRRRISVARMTLQPAMAHNCLCCQIRPDFFGSAIEIAALVRELQIEHRRLRQGLRSSPRRAARPHGRIAGRAPGSRQDRNVSPDQLRVKPRPTVRTAR